MDRQFIGKHKMIIGMAHLLPLPGSPLHDFDGGMNKIIDRAFEDVENLIAGGVDGIQIENQWDRPFQKNGKINLETIAAMASVTGLLKKNFNFPMGVNVHLNGGMEAMAIAATTGCDWIRVFELCNAYIANSSGIIEANGPELLRYRMNLRMDKKIKILGDFHVKHGSHSLVADRNSLELARDVESALADALIITGFETGKAPDFESIEKIRKGTSLPIFIGSGLSISNLSNLLPVLDGAVVGSGFKENGDLMKPISTKLVTEFMNKVNDLRK